VRQLLPVLIDPVDPSDVYAEAFNGTGRPFVRLNMVASADGGTATSGVSGGLSGPADHDLFYVIVVGAGTARSERYGPSRLSTAVQEWRRHRGQAALPPIAVVTRSCQLDWEAPFFSQASARPIVITVSAAAPADRDRAARAADVILAGDRDVDLGRAFDALAERGSRALLVEGGPSLNGQLAAAGLIDELCLTVSPRLLSGAAARILVGQPLSAPMELRLASVCEQDGFLFLRFRAPRPGT
jgi:riboflavin biosynthesis pyrimidine reductase